MQSSSSVIFGVLTSGLSDPLDHVHSPLLTVSMADRNQSRAQSASNTNTSSSSNLRRQVVATTNLLLQAVERLERPPGSPVTDSTSSK